MVFNEEGFGHGTKGASRRSFPETVDIQPSSDVILKQEEQAKPKQRRPSERIKQPPVRYGIDAHVDTAVDSIQHHAYSACQIIEPQTMKEVLIGNGSEEWKQKADAECASLLQNEAWGLVKKPSGRQATVSKWVYKVKSGNDGNVEPFKARLFAKDYAHKHGINYNEAFSPVVKFSLIRVLLAFAFQNDLLLHQMDVVTTFLNGTLDEEIQMQQPDGNISKERSI